MLRLPHAQGLPEPRYETDGAAGIDLLAAICENSPILMEKFGRALVPTGISLQIPEGYEAQVRPRSGLALRHGVTVLNAPGTIDSDYRGEIKALLVNLGEAPFTITRGMRIAQLVLAPVTRAALTEVSLIAETERGAGGFGSTGI
ncbi:MAG: dUTP diphosphatase [Salinarimonadaceae bacterium]|nr:MAG: dUTP diphosphatase [Salinarimonadaceae bacterium]